MRNISVCLSPARQTMVVFGVLGNCASVRILSLCCCASVNGNGRHSSPEVIKCVRIEQSDAGDGMACLGPMVGRLRFVRIYHSERSTYVGIHTDHGTKKKYEKLYPRHRRPFQYLLISWGNRTNTNTHTLQQHQTTQICLLWWWYCDRIKFVIDARRRNVKPCWAENRRIE